jgi:ASC-1-like (ASCH) protein
MNTWESGRESNLLDDIIAGRKTIEGRLNRDKFANYTVGDEIWLRRDHRDNNGILHDGEPHAGLVKIVNIRRYKTFLELTTSEDFKKVIPYAKTAKQAADEYNRFYSNEDQAKYGVLAIEIKYLHS